MTQAVQAKILSGDERIASRLRSRLSITQTLSLNFIGSAGSGKTALLERTLGLLPPGIQTAVLMGENHAHKDAIRLSHCGYPVRQIKTAGASHLNAEMVENHLEGWKLELLDLLLIESVGNFGCPNSYDLGEDAKVVVLSVTDEEDTPLKHPSIFQNAELLIISKIDLMPYVPFRPEVAREYALRIHPGMKVIETSAASGAGLDQWMNWITARMSGKRPVARRFTEVSQ